MSTSTHASTVIAKPIDQIWEILRSFTSASLISTIESVDMEEGKAPTEVGAHRTLKWKTGEVVTQRLLELSDIKRRVVWENVSSEPVAEVTATITTLQAHRITDGNATLLTWTAEYSADAKGDFIAFNTKALQQNLAELKNALEQQ
ncbi:hypothetical protein QOT17_007298 [Balamuthia mandrillaris]